MQYDGDEFVMMFASISPDTFEAKLEKICGDISALSIDGMEEGQHISVSIGGAVGPDVPAALMKKADEMLRKAKNNRGTGRPPAPPLSCQRGCRGTTAIRSPVP